MERFSTYITLAAQELNAAAETYHFGKEKAALMERVYAAMSPIRGRAYIEPAKRLPGQENTGEGSFLLCAVTLGREQDALQERLSGEGRLTECYMADCLSMECLKKAYQDIAIYAADKYGLWVRKLCFPGSGYPLEWIAEILGRLPQDEIKANGSYMLSPLKSAVYAAELSGEEMPCGPALCEGCRNTAACSHAGRGGLSFMPLRKE